MRRVMAVFLGCATAAVLLGLVASGADGAAIKDSSTRAGTAEGKSAIAARRTLTTLADAQPAAFVQQGSKLHGSGASGIGSFGARVALSADGNTALVGAPLDNSSTGAAWVFVRSGITWTQQGSKLIAGDESGAGEFGASVALSADGNTALIGGDADSSDVGAVWAFTRSNGTWSQQGTKLTPSDETGASKFGSSVALSGDGNTGLIGGPGDAGDIGGAWAFDRSSATWTEGAKLTGADESGQGQFGFSVALSTDGTIALIGGPTDANNDGAGWAFTRSGANWAPQGGKLTASGAPGAGGGFGYGVALSSDGGTAVVGGPFDASYAGAAWVLTRSGATWTHGAKLTSTDASDFALFGSAVALSADGNTAVIGGAGDTSGAGAIWSFKRTGGTWAQGQKAATTDGAGTSFAGTSVALSSDGRTALVGGPADNGQVGAAWVFTPPAPAAPTNVTATAGNAQATVTFTAPAGPVSSYTVTRQPGGTTTSGTASPITVPGLTNGTAYTFTVTATNAGGTSPPSQPSAPVTPAAPPPGAPAAPTNVAATAGSAQATVTFTAPAGPVDSYTVTRQPGGTTTSGTASPITVPGLTNGTAYTFTVTATNAGGTSPPSQPSAPVTPTSGAPAATPPAAPIQVVANPGDGEATVTFRPPASDGGAAIQSYTLTAMPGGATVVTSGSPAFFFGLANGTSYTFTVTATNTAGTGPASAPSSAVVPTAGGRTAAAPPAETPRTEPPTPPAGTNRPPRPPH